MKKLSCIALLSISLLYSCQPSSSFEESIQNQSNIQKPLKTEHFIREHLQVDNGQLQTNLTDRKNEFLSESMGLWMAYLLEKNDRVQFHEQVNILQDIFLTKDHLVIWEIKDGQAASANAFIDDLRIVDLLYQAGEKWAYAPYTNLANQMAKALNSYQTEKHYLVDFIDVHSKKRGKSVTLSYIMPSGLDQMRQAQQLHETTYTTMKTLLVNAPLSTSHLYPQSYDIVTEQYMYDEEVNMIDQFYIAYHLAQWNEDISSFVSMAKELFERADGKIFGRYDHSSKDPIVTYESAAVYGLAILMCLEIDDDVFAQQLYDRMKTLQYNDQNAKLDGGYIDPTSNETHSFDNLLALLAERKGLNQGVFDE
ncbi:MAG TPA: lipoprotein YdaJ [Sporosarcina sp.]|nr:lipoprotein YdaJ [Sporosarcina sp.]